MTTETTAELNPANIEAKLTAADEVQVKILQIEDGFRQVEAFLLTARNFLFKHSGNLEGLDFRCWGWSQEVVFMLYGQVRDPKEIARRFGSDGWTREHDKYTCGAVHWVKTVDGVRLKVENAESIKPTLNPTVRL